MKIAFSSIFFLLNILCVSSFADNQQDIDIITGLAKPPYIFKEEIGQKHKGLQIDLVEAAFSVTNITTTFTAMSLARNITGYQRWNMEGILTLPESYQYPGMYLSKPYITYQNVAITLADRNIRINSFDDLTGKSIIAFQTAKKFIGDSYTQVVAYSLDYREFADQNQQIDMLFSGRTEVIILDLSIFKHYMSQLENSKYKTAVTIHSIFEKQPYSAGFKSEELRDIFDLGIQTIKDNGQYQAIIDSYF